MKVGVPVEPGTYEIVVDQFCGFFIRERHGSHYVPGRSASPFIEISHEMIIENKLMLLFRFREGLFVGHRPFDPLVVTGPWLGDSFPATLLFFLRGRRLE